MTRTQIERFVGAARFVSAIRVGGRPLMPVVNSRCCKAGNVMCDRCAAKSLATVVKNQPPKANDGIDWHSLGQLLGVEADPDTNMVGFVRELQAKLNEALQHFEAKPAAPPEDDEGEPVPADEPVTANRRGFFGSRGDAVFNSGPPEDDEMETIRAMMSPEIDWGRKSRERQERRQAQVANRSPARTDNAELSEDRELALLAHGPAMPWDKRARR